MGNVAIRTELINEFPKKKLQKNARDEQVRAQKDYIIAAKVKNEGSAMLFTLVYFK
jgi:hypothetical protein